MAPVHALDKYYLALTFLITLGYQMLGFAIAWTFQVRSLYSALWIFYKDGYYPHSSIRLRISLEVHRHPLFSRLCDSELSAFF